ncbi:MAG: hypothetical protein JXA73_14220 [Acidobacteria bacterium]|nr:hypothetical protein [Acidobacteriota bacterium]
MAKTTTDAKGYFSFGKAKHGQYYLILSSPAAREGYLIEVKGRNIFHWVRNNWLEIGLGLVRPEGCPPSYIKASRRKESSTE